MPNKRKNFTNEPRTTRDLILDIAQEEIAEKGLEGMRLKDIADQVGIQLPSLYAHFASRKELLEALADQLMDELIAIYENLQGLPPREALLASADRTIDFYVAKRGYARMLLADFPAPYDHSIFNKTSVKIGKVLKILNQSIQLGIAEGTVRDIPPDLFLSFRMGVTLFPLFMRGNQERKEMVRDPEVIDRIKRESNRLLSLYITPV